MKRYVIMNLRNVFFPAAIENVVIFIIISYVEPFVACHCRKAYQLVFISFELLEIVSVGPGQDR
jgi:hypothetical protein